VYKKVYLLVLGVNSLIETNTSVKVRSVYTGYDLWFVGTETNSHFTMRACVHMPTHTQANYIFEPYTFEKCFIFVCHK
jgi:hypothetical protein